MTMFVRLACLLRRRHHYRFRGSGGRVYMECSVCGYRSHGWEMGPKAKPLARPSSKLRFWLDETVLLPPTDADKSFQPVRDPGAPPQELRLQLDT